MKLRVAKWGNSLAVRLPAGYVRKAGLKEGESVVAEVSPMGAITLTPGKAFDRAAFVKKVRKLRAGMPSTSSTVAALRSEERY